MSLKEEISRSTAWLQFLWLGRPKHIIFFGHGIGDDLLCTALAHELKRRDGGKIVMFSRYGPLFQGNPDISAVHDLRYPTMGRLRRWGYPSLVPQYSGYDPATDRDIFQREHIITTMCRAAGLTGAIELRPYMSLSEREKISGRYFERQAVIQSSGLPPGPGMMKNKDWYPERFQAVAREIGSELRLIQLGQMSDPPLEGVLDLRGRTTLRQSAAILSSSQLFIGQVGFLMHLARAVDCRSTIVYGGREEPLISGYRGNENIIGPTVCSPCWQRNKCDYGRECMQIIGVEEVVAAVRRQLARVDTPLEVERVNLEPSRTAAT
jgi:hypothetical protein